MTITLIKTETEAAELEGLAPLDTQSPEVLAAYERYLARSATMDELKAAQDADKLILSRALESQQLQGLTRAGKVRVRLSAVTTNRVDAKKLRQQLPDVFARFMTTTKSQRLTVS